jgi:hypothetical protein
LVIEILDSGWVKAIQSVAPELLDKLKRATAGEVKAIAIAGDPSTIGSGPPMVS